MQNPEQNAGSRPGAGEAAADSPRGQQAWEEPKLTFLAPKLTKHGTLEDVTAGFIGTFTPTPPG
jgi:hypothetical protein